MNSSGAIRSTSFADEGLKRPSKSFIACSLVLAVLATALWSGIRFRQRAAAMKSAAVAADNLRKRNVLLTGSPAETANLTSRPMDEEFVRDLSKLVYLKTLNLKGTDTNDAHLARILPNLNLISLVLNATPVADTGMESVATQHRLETLMLADTHVGDTGLATIARLRNLTELNLSRTRITDDGLAHIAGLPNLVRLILDGTKITDEGLIHLASIPKLVVLEARETSVTPEGLRSLRRLKPGVTVKR